MASKASRRELLATTVVAMAGVALTGTAGAQEQPKPDPAEIETISKDIEKQMAKPLSEEAKKLLPGAIQNSLNMRKDRLKFKLPENSEPCTVYAASAVVKR